MTALIVEVENRPGEMAEVTETLANRGINILVFGVGVGDRSALGLVASDEQGSRSALDDAGIAYRELPVLHVKMKDKPGQAADVCRRLADDGINIELWLPVDTSKDKFTVALGVDNIEAARETLREQLVEYQYASR
jgi:hypothetical protein